MQTGDSHVELSLPHLQVYHDQHSLITGLFTSPARSTNGVFESASRMTIMQATVEEPYDPEDPPEEEIKEPTYVFLRDFFVGVWDGYMSGLTSTSTVTVDWDDWGPQNSRLLDLALEPLPDNS